MAQKDVEIKIRARDDASKGVRKISEALKSLSRDTEKAAQGAGKANSSFGALANDLGRLETQAQKLKVFDAVAGNISRAKSAIDTLAGSLERNGKGFASLRQEVTQSAEALAKLRATQDAFAGRLVNVRSRQAEITAQHKANTAAVSQAKAALDAYNASLAKTKNAGPAQTSAGVFLRGDYKAATAARSGFSAGVTDESRALAAEGKQLRDQMKDLTPEVNAAARAHRNLEGELTKTGNAVLATRADIAKERDELRQLEDAARQAGAGTKVLSGDQSRLANDSAKLQAQMETTRRAMEAMAKFSTGTGSFADPKTAAAMRQQVDAAQLARAEWKALEAETARLGRGIQTLSGNATAQVDAFKQVAAASRAAKTEYERQANTIRQTSGTNRSSFLAWSQAVTASTQSAVRGNQQVATSANQAAAAQARLAPMVQRTVQATQQGSQATRQFGGALLGLNGDTRQTLSLMQRLRGEVLALTTSFLGLYAAVNQIGQSINAFRDLEAVQSRLGAIFDQDMGRVGQEVSFLRGEADRLGISFSVLGNQYAKFAVAADQAGFAQENVREMFLSVAEAGRVNKLSLDQLNGTFLAIEQIISKGKFTSEEVRRQLGDRLPGAFNLLAKAMGVTTAELDKMMSQGELLATEGNLLKFTRQMSAQFGPQLSASLDTLTTDIGRFQNNIFKARLALAEGFIPALRSALQSFDEFANSAEGQAVFVQIGDAVGSLIGVLAEVPKYFDDIKLGLTALVALKVGGWVLGVANNVTKARASFMGLGQSMAFIGPQMQRMSLTQQILGQNFARLSDAMNTYRVRLMATTTATGVARAGMVGLATTIGALRTGMILTANVARAMWAAIGGIPGIIATGITFAVTSWLTSTNTATTALAEHQRQLNSVQEAYERTSGAAKNWADEVKNVTSSQMLSSLTKLRGEYDAMVESLRGSAMEQFSFGLGAMFTDREGLDGFKEVQALIDDLQNGAVSLTDVLEELDRIATETGSNALREFAVGLQDIITEGEDGEQSLQALEKAIKQSEAALRFLNNQASDADKELLGLAETTAEVNDNFRDSAAVETYTQAIDTLKKAIPELADEMERLQKITELNKAAFEGMVAAVKSGDFSKIGEILGLLGRATGQIQTEAMLSELKGSSAQASATLIKKYEGYRPDAYWDVNAYRTGYGSDTVTAADGTVSAVTRDTITTLADAERDLARRIAEFQSTVEKQIGADRFETFSNEQQGVLTSIAYNYGSLPDRIVDAIQTGNVEQISAAIRGLGTDNEGINLGRRLNEAMVFEGAGPADITPMVETNAERQKELEEQRKTTQELIADNEFQIKQQEMKNAGLERQAAIEAAIREARAENPAITEEQLALIERQAATLWDIENATRDRELAEERVNQLYSLRQQLLEQQQMLKDQGDMTGAAALQTELLGVNEQLERAIANAIAMWQAVGGAEADAAIAKLNTQRMSLKASNDQVIAFGLNASQMQTLVGSAVDGLVGGLDAMAKATAEGKNAFKAAGQAFLQFAADFLRQIGLMIAKQIILNLLAGMGGPVGAAAGAMGGRAGHTGGVVGSAAIGTGNRLGQPAWVGSAFRYHTGGVAGLRPDEVSATLKKGEEILTEEDPRHRDNLGGGEAAQRRDGIKQVLAIGDDEIANAMSGGAGEDVVITHIRRNRSTIRKELGV